MGRVYVASTPATRGEEPDSSSPVGVVGPEGRFYRESEDAKAEKARVSNPTDQAALLGTPGPTKDEMKAAKKEQKAADASSEPPVVVDAAAETPVEEPIELASEVAGDPPIEAPGANASRADWERYARSQGATDEDLEGLKRNDIRDKYAPLI